MNDRNIHIDLDNIDTRDPDSDGKLINLKIAIWIDKAEDLENSQNCVWGLCSYAFANEIQGFDISTNQAQLFNPISTEDTSDNNLLNYNGNPEPGWVSSTTFQAQTSDNISIAPISFTGPGNRSYSSTFQRFSDNTSIFPRRNEQLKAKWQVLPFWVRLSNNTLVNWTKSQICSKIDTTQYEFVGLPSWDKWPVWTDANREDWVFWFEYYWKVDTGRPRITQSNPSLMISGWIESPQQFVLSDGNNVTTTLYSAIPNGDGSLKAIDETICWDDVDWDGFGNILYADGTQTHPGNPIDWYEDFSLVPDAADGTSGVSKIRLEYAYDREYVTNEHEAFGGVNHTRTVIGQIYDLRVRNDATGYGWNNYMPIFSDVRYSTLWDNSSFWSWIDNSSDDVHDPDSLSFGYNSASADRNVLVDSDISLEKKTLPAGLKVVRGGDTIDFELTPSLVGLWANSETWTITDTLPAWTSYVWGSEEFSIDNGATWLSYQDYIASNPDITLVSSSQEDASSPLVWEFDSLDAWEQMPRIKYSVYVDESLTSGNFTNTAVFSAPNIAADTYITDTSGDGTPDTGDWVWDDVARSYQLTILPEYGFDVLKTTAKQVESVNSPITFDLVYRNLWAEEFSGGRFIDILPFNGDNAVGIGGKNSSRAPASNFAGSYELTNITRENNETIYVTSVNPNNLNLDACASSNTPAGYIPTNPILTSGTANHTLDKLCYQDYINNGNMLPDMQASGTNSAAWEICTSTSTTVDVVNECPIDAGSITAIRFDTTTLPAAWWWQVVSITITPSENIWGTPNYTSSPNASPVYLTVPNGAQVVDWENSPNLWNVYTNSFGGRIPEISLNVISNDVSVTVVSGSIGDRVWYDINNDGVQDAGEPGIENVTVNLLDSSGNPIYYDPATGIIVASTNPNATPYTAMTNANGEYLFDNLPLTDYQVEVDDITLPPSGVQSYDSDDTTAFSGSATTPHISSHTLTTNQDTLWNVIDGEANEDQDFGYYYEPLFDIWDFVWEDINMDGIQDVTETGLENITVNLLSSTGVVIASTLTDSNWAYLFEDTISGEYFVEVEVPTWYALSPSGAGWDDMLDSDIDRSTSRTPLLDFAIPYNDMSIDAGIFELENLTLWGTIFNDFNDDTLFQTGTGSVESPIWWVEVHLYQDTNNDWIYSLGDTYLASSNTDSSGNYLFTNLTFGEYIVVIPETNFAWGSVLESYTSSDDTLTINDPDTDVKNEDNWSQGTSSWTGTFISSQAVTLLQGTEPTNDGDIDADTNLTVDFGVILPVGSISGQVSEFLNNIAQSSLPLAGVELDLYEDLDGNGIPDTTTPVDTTLTDINGNYSFTDIPFWDYIVVETQPSGFRDYSQVEWGSDGDSNTSSVVTNRISVKLSSADSNKDDEWNNFQELRLSNIGWGSSSSRIVPVSPITPKPEVLEVSEEFEVPEVLEVPLVEPIVISELPKPESEKRETPDIAEIESKLKKYEQKTPVEKIIPSIIEDAIPWETRIRTLPAILPRTWTPIWDRVETLPNRIVSTQLPSSETFRLAWDTNEDISHWKQVLPQEDRDAGRYVVIPSNGLVIPVNSFAEDSKDFDAMINGREGNINPALRSWALEYPGSSTKGYGEVGNKVIFGHSSYFANELGRYKTHFQKIIELDQWEEIWIYEKQANNQYKRYRYKTEKSYNTDDSDTSVLLPWVGKNLTLFTCTPIWGITGRWIIKAKFIEESEENNQTQIEYIWYFDTLPLQLKRVVTRLISTIETIDQEDTRLSMYYRVYDRVGLLLSQEDDTQRKLLLEYVEYKVIEKILEFQE